ncbi:MAG: C/D box methylation guide ribonucleoprotein complex aNOP56 subunit [Candidatus Odinarchaeia archaeon]
MKAYLTLAPIGIAAYDQKSNLIEFINFPKDPHKIAIKILNMQEKLEIPEIVDLIDRLIEKGYVILTSDIEEVIHIIKISKFKENIKAVLSNEIEFFKELRIKLEKHILDSGLFSNPFELTQFLNQLGLEYSKEKVRRASQKKDMLISQAIESLDDLDRTLNLASSRLREWYSLYFPELNELISNHETYVKIVSEIGFRENFSIENLERLGIPQKKAEVIIKVLNKTAGADIGAEDINIIKVFANMIKNQYLTRVELEKYLDKIMEETAPNIKNLVGPLLGARLINLAGSLENLSKIPASTIQVLGAEKALFLSLKTGRKPPKHGIIFQHALIHNSPKWQRGKLARALAGKLSIAARVDYYSKNIDARILEDLERRINEIKKKYPKPSERKIEKKISKSKKYRKKKMKKKKKAKNKK